MSKNGSLFQFNKILDQIIKIHIYSQ